MAAQRSSLLTYCLVAGGALLVIGGCGFFSVVTFGMRMGKELSPDTFEIREFAYFEAPFLGTQLTQNDRTDVTPPLTGQLVADKQITAGKTSRWDLIDQSPRQHAESAYDARLLEYYLTAKDSQGKIVWATWSQEHPKIAAVLWPQVQSLAKENLYVFIPELFRVAETSKSAQEFQTQADAVLSTKYRELGEWQIALGNSTRAAELLKKAIDHGDTSKETDRLYRQNAGPEAPTES